jgi:hypothetical protein
MIWGTNTAGRKLVVKPSKPSGRKAGYRPQDGPAVSRPELRARSTMLPKAARLERVNWNATGPWSKWLLTVKLLFRNVESVERARLQSVPPYRVVKQRCILACRAFTLQKLFAASCSSRSLCHVPRCWSVG